MRYHTSSQTTITLFLCMFVNYKNARLFLALILLQHCQIWRKHFFILHCRVLLTNRLVYVKIEVCLHDILHQQMVPLSIGSIKKAMWQVGKFSALVTVTEKGEPSVQLYDTNLPRRLLGEKNTYAVACWHSAHLATWWLWVLKIRVEEVISTVTSWTDLKFSYVPGCLAVVRMEHKLWFYYVLAC